MPYLNLLRELSETYNVWMDSANGGWAISLSLKDKLGQVFHTGPHDTPEAAVRGIYLKVNPIKRNTFDGKLTQG